MNSNNEEHIENLKWFKKFTKTCNKNNIWYAATNGTLLGAIRENGPIEWDDDYDVMMTPQSYEKLKELFPKNCIDGTNESKYPLIIPKFIPNRKKFLSSAIFVDIFIVVKTNNKNVRKYRGVRKKVNFSMQVMNSKWKPYIWYIWIYKFFCWPFKFLVKKISYKTSIKILQNNNNYDYYFTIDNPIDPKKINIIDVLTFSTIKKQFSNFTIDVPVEYNDILIRKYNKYMIPNKWQRPFIHSNTISIVKTKKNKL